MGVITPSPGEAATKGAVLPEVAELLVERGTAASSLGFSEPA